MIKLFLLLVTGSIVATTGISFLRAVRIPSAHVIFQPR
jgi:hypothetical protein